MKQKMFYNTLLNIPRMSRIIWMVPYDQLLLSYSVGIHKTSNANL